MNRRLALVPLALMLIVACERSPAGSPPEVAASDSVKMLATQLAQAKAVTAQQDSVLNGVKEATQLLDEIDKEISHVKGVGSGARKAKKGEGPADPRIAARDRLLGKVKQVTRLLAENRAKVKTLSEGNDSLTARASGLEQTITSLEQMVERQKMEVAALSASIDSLKTVNTQVVAQRDAQTDTAKVLRHENNTVYYVVGTKKELVARGIITEEGAKRFLLFGGRTVIPARKLDSSAFTSIDKFAELDIPLNPTRRFQIISRHDSTLTQVTKTPDGTTATKVHIVNPVQFWSASKYLIILEG